MLLGNQQIPQNPQIRTWNLRNLVSMTVEMDLMQSVYRCLYVAFYISLDFTCFLPTYVHNSSCSCLSVSVQVGLFPSFCELVCVTVSPTPCMCSQSWPVRLLIRYILFSLFCLLGYVLFFTETIKNNMERTRIFVLNWTETERDGIKRKLLILCRTKTKCVWNRRGLCVIVIYSEQQRTVKLTNTIT